MDCTMRKPSNFATARRLEGFTLIELMIAVSVATILTVIAVPSYINTVRKSHRTEVKAILLDLAGREERYLATNGVYTTDATQLGFSTGFGNPVGSAYYKIDTPTVSAATVSSSTLAATPPGYSFVAEAINGQTKDTQCAQFTLNQSGVQGSLNSGGAASTGCW
jgi:type IV pilus assembly protein PilE